MKQKYYCQSVIQFWSPNYEFRSFLDTQIISEFTAVDFFFILAKAAPRRRDKHAAEAESVMFKIAILDDFFSIFNQLI